MNKNLNRFKKNFCAIIVLIIIAQFSHGQSTEITHGPYIQFLSTNSVVINWSSSVDCISWVEYYEEDGSSFYQKERERIYNSTDGLKNIGKLHKVIVNNLKPSTKYAYRIYSQEVTGNGNLGKVTATQIFGKEPLYFTTLEVEKEQISCIILSDMHEHTAKIGNLLNNVEWNKTDFVLLNGDFINQFREEKTLYNVIDTCVDIFAKETPLYIVRGNHETRGLKARELNQYFHFPKNKYYYSFSSGNTFFIVLDSGEDKPDSDIEYKGFADFDSYRNKQAEWLSGVVESEDFKKAEQKIVFMHIPPFTERRGGEWHGELEIRNKFVPILNKADISLMLCGHMHSYLYIPEKAGENNFPIIVPDHNSRVNLVVDAAGIRVKIVNTDSKVTSDLFFNIQ